MTVFSEIKQGTYYDSVTLMRISQEVKSMDGVKDVLVGMGTTLNKDMARSMGILSEEAAGVGNNDLFIVFSLEDGENPQNIFERIEALLNPEHSESAEGYNPITLREGLKYAPEGNIVLISLPGQYVYEEAKFALENNRHVMIFSDNVPINQELELKQIAVEKGLLLMGPDCGTAIINKIPLGFANIVRKGSIGIVGASGTGIQEVSALIHRKGRGIAQAIGVGGRDLKDEIGGLMMIQGVKALIDDSQTEVIVIISKPPSASVAKKIMNLAKRSQKPVVVDFVGDVEAHDFHYGNSNVYLCETLEETALRAIALVQGENKANSICTKDQKRLEEIEEKAAEESEKYGQGQKYILGLFAGGTLASETISIIEKNLGTVYSNIHRDPVCRVIPDDKTSMHLCVDLGEDAYTVGRPHPMIDMSTRNQWIEESINEDVAVLLIDIVFGSGANKDPVGAMEEALAEAKKSMEEKGKHLTIICSICGTENDIQDYERAKKRLEALDVIVAESNAHGADLAVAMVRGRNEKLEPIRRLFKSEISVINMGIDSFYQDLMQLGVKIVHIDWRPPAGGNDKMLSLLSRLKSKGDD